MARIVGEYLNEYCDLPAQIRAMGDDETDQLKWQYIDELDSVGGGKWMLLPTGIFDNGVILDASSGEGYIEATRDNLIEVKAGEAVLVDVWDKGTITSEIAGMSVKPSAVAIRQVNVSGTTKMIWTGQ